MKALIADRGAKTKQGESMNRKNEPPVLIDNPTTYRFAGERTQILLSGEQTDGAFAMLAVDKSPGASTPRHLHEREEETLYVVEGTVTAIADDREYKVSAGRALYLPRCGIHQLINRTDRHVKYLLVCTPAGFENFVTEAGEPWDEAKEGSPMTEKEIQRLLAAAPRHAITILK
jgi:quercetin dioxygenase-like cupin family protein